FKKELRLNEKIIILSGNVKIEYGNFIILADNAVAFFSEDNKLDKVYAEGAILIRRGKDRISADAFFYDFNKEYGKIINGCIITTKEAMDRFSPAVEDFFSDSIESKQKEIELFVKAEIAETDKLQHYLAEKVTISTCSFAEPHWGLICSHAVVYPGGELEAYGNTIYMGPVSFPIFPIRLERNWKMPLHRLAIGSTTKFGTYVLSEWRFFSGKSYDTLVAIDNYSKRGTGCGVTAAYKGEKDHLLFRGYYIDDKGEDKKNVPLTVTERYRSHLLYRHEFSTNTHLDTELSKVSDQNFMNQYFEKEVKEFRLQENYIYLRSTKNNLGARLFTKFRTENFLTETEYLPEMRVDIISQPIFAGLYCSSSLEAANLRKEYKYTLSIPTEETQRIDMETKLERPFSAAQYVSFNPFFTTQFSSYSANPYDDNRSDRTTLSAGILTSSQISRKYPIKSSFLKLESLTHVLSPVITYSNRFENSLSPEYLYQFDETDSIKEEEKVTLLLSNKLITKKKKGEEYINSEFISHDLKIHYFPNAERDNLNNEYSNLFSELRIAVLPSVSLSYRSQYNIYENRPEINFFSLKYSYKDDFDFSVSACSAKGQNMLMTFASTIKLSEKWQACAKYQYDTVKRSYSMQTYTLTRTFHCWIMEFGYQMERETGEKKFIFWLSPLSVFQTKKLKSPEAEIYLK
ncbi:MAG: LPS assembly protein LptD, partial [Planctomycetota bacterium]